MVPHKEIVELIINNAKFSQGLKIAQDDLYEFKQTVSKLKFNLNISDAEAGTLAIQLLKDRTKAQREVDKGLHQYRLQSIKEKEAAEIASIKRAADAALESFKLIKTGEDSQNKFQADRLSQRAADEKKIIKELIAEDRIRAKLDKEDANRARAIRVAAAKEEQSRLLQITKANIDSQNYIIEHRRKWYALVHQEEMGRIRARRDERKAEHALSSVGKTSFTASQALRIGAGASVMTGNYNLGGGMYAAANVMHSAMPKAIQVSTAALVGFGAALTGVLGTVGALFYGRGFNEELAKMSTLLADASTSTEEFEKTLDDTASAAIRVSNKFNMDLVEVVKSFKDALSSGIEARDLERFMDVAGTLSTALGTNLSEATNILTTFKDSYQLTISELATVNDYLFNSVDVGKISIKDMTANLSRLVPIAKAAGVGIKDMFLGVDVMTRQGLSTSQSITSMTQFINGLVSPTEKAEKALHAAGIATGDMAFAGKSLKTVLESIKGATGGSASLLGEFFSEERGKRGAALMLQSMGALLDDTSKGLDKVGTTAIASGRAMSTVWTDAGKVLTSYLNLIKETGSALADLLEQAGKGLKATSGFSDKDQLHAELVTSRMLKSGAGKDEIFSELTKDNLGAYYRKQVSILIDEMVGKFAAGGRDSATSFSTKLAEGLTETNAKIAEAVNNMTALPKDKLVSKRKEKHIEKRLSDADKEEIEDLKLLNEELTAELEIKKKLAIVDAEREAADALRDVNTAKQKLDKVIADPKSSAEYIEVSKANLVEFERKYKEIVSFITDDIYRLSGGDVLIDLANQIKDNQTKIAQTLEEADASVFTTEEWNWMDKKEDEYFAKKKAKKEKDAEHYFDVYEKSLEKIYNKEVQNAEKALKKKEQLIEASEKRVESVKAFTAGKTEDIWKNSFNSKASGDDPDRQRRYAMEQRDIIKGQMDSAIGSGASEEQWKKLVERFEVAMNAVLGNTTDEGRGKRNFQEDQSTLSALLSAYSAQFQKGEFSIQDGINTKGGYKTKSKEQMQAEALKKTDETIQVEKIRMDAVIKLSVDGTVSPETLDALSTQVIDKINAMNNNKNGGSKFDKPKRDEVPSFAEDY